MNIAAKSPAHAVLPLTILVFLFFFSGCASRSALSELRYETRADLSRLQNGQVDLQQRLEELGARMEKMIEAEQRLETDTQRWLSESAAKLTEMEDRVVEIRILLMRNQTGK